MLQQQVEENVHVLKCLFWFCFLLCTHRSYHDRSCNIYSLMSSIQAPCLIGFFFFFLSLSFLIILKVFRYVCSCLSRLEAKIARLQLFLLKCFLIDFNFVSG